MNGESPLTVALGAVWSGALRFPRLTLLGFAMLTGLAASGLPRLAMRTDGAALVDPDSPATLADAAVRSRFGVDDQVLVAIENDASEGIYVPVLLEAIVRGTALIAAIPGVPHAGVQSLANEGSDRVFPGTLRFRPWLDPVPADERALQALAADIRQIGIYAGKLVSVGDVPRAAAILVDLPRGDMRTEQVGRILQIAEELEGELCAQLPTARVHVAGAPVAEVRLGERMVADLLRLVPLALITMAVVFWAFFRSLLAALLPLLEVGTVLIGVFGLAGWCDVPVSLPLIVVPVILTAVGVTDEVHVFTAYARHSARGLARPAAVRAAMSEKAPALFATSLTTAVAFASFSASPLTPLRHFGACMAVGVVMCFACTITAIPASLILLRVMPFGFGGTAEGSEGMQRLARMLDRAGRPAWILILLSLPLLVVGVQRVRVRDSWLSSFAPRSELVRSTERIESLFSGTHLLRIELDASVPSMAGLVERAALDEFGVSLPLDAGELAQRMDGARFSILLPGLPDRPIELSCRVASAALREGRTRLEFASGGRPIAGRVNSGLELLEWRLDGSDRLLVPHIIARVQQFEDALARTGKATLGEVLGPARQLATMNYMLHSRRPSERRLPLDEESGEARLRDVVDRYRLVRGDERTAELFDESRERGQCVLFLRAANYEDTAALLALVDELAREILHPIGVHVRIGGDVALSQEMIRAVVRSQIRSLGWSLALVALCAAALLRSVRLGALCTLPAALTIAGLFAAIGYGNVPLGVATSMFAACVLGFGVDAAIHLCLAARDAGVGSATVSTLRPALVDTLAVSLGFGTLAFSTVPPTGILGQFVAGSALAALLLTFLLLPRVLAGSMKDAHLPR